MNKENNSDSNFDRLMNREFGKKASASEDAFKMIDKINEKYKLDEKEGVKGIAKWPSEKKPDVNEIKPLPYIVKSMLIDPIGSYLTEHNSLPTMKYSFSSALLYDKYNRIHLSDWKYCANFLINSCNTFQISVSEDEQKSQILKSAHFAQTVKSLHTALISPSTFVHIFEGNKPLISFGLNSAQFFRKNILFLILYIHAIQQLDKRKELDIEHLASIWITELINYKYFSNFKASLFLRKNYKKTLEANKLSTIRYFNDVVLMELEFLLSQNSLSTDWIQSIRKTYSNLFGDNYKKCVAKKEIPFLFFSRDELDMFLYILHYNISLAESFPIAFENLLNEILIYEGIDSTLIDNLNKELSSL